MLKLYLQFNQFAIVFTMAIVGILAAIVVALKPYFIIKVSILWVIIIIEEFVVSVIKIFIIMECQFKD